MIEFEGKCLSIIKDYLKIPVLIQTRQVYNGPQVVKFISVERKTIFGQKMIFEQKQMRKMNKSYIIND